MQKQSWLAVRLACHTPLLMTPERRREIARAYYHRNKDKARAYRQANKERDHARIKAWTRAHPEADRAHYTANNAIKRGLLVRQPCEGCGTSEQVQKHHDDYSKPLQVRWLCRTCHMALHRRDYAAD